MKIIQRKVNQKQTKTKNKNKKDIKSNNNILNKIKIAKVNNYVSKTAKIGKNVKIWHFAYVGDNTIIGDNGGISFSYRL